MIQGRRWLPLLVLFCFISYVTPLGRRFWVVPLFLAAVLGIWLFARRGAAGGVGLGGSGYLCDTCKYSYGDVCNLPEKPNVTRCPDYKHV